MNSDRKFLKPKKGMTFDTGKMHNKRNNENKIAVTHIDRIQDYCITQKLVYEMVSLLVSLFLFPML